MCDMMFYNCESRMVAYIERKLAGLIESLDQPEMLQSPATGYVSVYHKKLNTLFEIIIYTLERYRVSVEVAAIDYLYAKVRSKPICISFMFAAGFDPYKII